MLGDGNPEAGSSNVPVQVLIDNVVTASAGTRSTFAITTDGQLWSWGDSIGALGRQVLLTEDEPAPYYIPTAIISDVVSVSVSLEHVLAIRNDGSLWAWGSFSQAQIGDGSSPGLTGINVQSFPTQILSEVKMPN